MRKSGRSVYGFFKRAADILFSLLLGIALLIPMTILCLVKGLWQKRSPVFIQERLGRDRKPFRLWKIRTMDENGRSDSLDRFLRRYSVDEIPQLWNILKGDMSFVGYRPVIPRETELIERRHALGVYEMRPGLTGWAQINGRDSLDPKTKAALDAYYRENCSFFLDVKILAVTMICVVKHKNVREI